MNNLAFPNPIYLKPVELVNNELGKLKMHDYHDIPFFNKEHTGILLGRTTFLNQKINF